jgi:hypothetical protein
LNGSKLENGVDFTAVTATNITLTSPAALNDVVDIICYAVFELSTAPTKDVVAYTVSTVADLASVPSSYTTAIVKDLNRGGTFIWSSTGTANGGTVFAGATGFWTRQYSGAVNVKWFGAKGDGVTDDTVAIQNCLNIGSNITGDSNSVYLIRDSISVPSDTSIDFCGGTIKDDVRTFYGISQAYRAKPLFLIYGVDNVSINNIKYEAVSTRATLNDQVPTAIFSIGANSTTGNLDTANINIANINATNCIDHTLFVSILGNTHDINIDNIEITGDCSYGINIEYGESASSDVTPNDYGQHPFNINVNNFSGYSNSASVGFLRVASCYNVKFTNCFGNNVTSFIYAWTGDRSINRVSQNVKFENCSTYNTLSIVDYCVFIASVSKDGSTNVDLPSWTNYDHSFIFENCNFRSNNTIDSCAIRFAGTKGNAVFNSCVIEKSYYGVRAEPISSVTYSIVNALVFNNCTFKKNTVDVLLYGVSGTQFNNCKIKDSIGTTPPVYIYSNVASTNFVNCVFSGIPSAISYIESAGAYTNIQNCNFTTISNTAPLKLTAVTTGNNNNTNSIYTPLCITGGTYYGVLSEPSSMQDSIVNIVSNNINSLKSNFYTAETGGVNQTIDSISNGRVGDIVTIVSMSSGATVTFNHFFSGVATSDRIWTPSGAQVVKTGSYWTVTLRKIDSGWVLHE